MQKWLFRLRQQLVKIRIRQEAQAVSKFPPLHIAETQTLEILPVFEAVSQSELKSGFGVSYLIRTDHAGILFDLGNNPAANSPSPLEQNMARLGISLDSIDMLVISHRHPDHVGGRNWWDKNTFSPSGASQPALGALPVCVPAEMAYPGSTPTRVEMPTKLAEDVATTGLFTFLEPYSPDQPLPKGSEQALAVNLAGRGILLIVGCGHMGLKNLLQRADTIFDAPVIGVVGGLHYGRASADGLQQELQFMQERRPQLLALSPHDSGPAAIAAFEKAFPTAYRPIRVGERIDVS